jgi:hypothetical protein
MFARGHHIGLELDRAAVCSIPERSAPRRLA